MLLKAYYWMIKSQKNRAIKMLKKVKKICEKIENKLILIWAQHCEKVLFNIRNNTCVFKIKIIYQIRENYLIYFLFNYKEIIL